MKTAIVYYSMNGNTKFVAEEIAKHIDADLIRIEPEKAFPDKGFLKFFWGGKSAVMGEEPKLQQYEFHPEKYERIIIGTPVWASSYTPPIKTFISENIESIKGMRAAAFTCFSGGGAEKALMKLKQHMEVGELDAELILIDPKDKPSTDHMRKIDEFCNVLLQ